MPADEPSWWYDGGRRPPSLTIPVSHVWGWAAKRRIARASPYRCALPVVCVGNFTAGGTGKTPLSILIAREMRKLGARPAFLTRGFGGTVIGPHKVDVSMDFADDVGDEALLLAREALVMVSHDRARGARLLAEDVGISAPSVIVMDDGLQNPGLFKNLSIAVVDGRRGVGNGRVIPAGPLRAPLDFQLGLVDAILVNRRAREEPTPAIAESLRKDFPGPVLEAWPEPDGDVSWVPGARVLAFAGIANPERFFALLETLGAQIVKREVFPDHNPFTEREARRLLDQASHEHLVPVTTEKDIVRLGGTGSHGELALAARTIPIVLAMSERDRVRLVALLEGVLAPP